MHPKIKAQIAKTRRFIDEHPTLTACAITGAVSWRVSHNRTLKAALGELKESTELMYTAGHEVGALEVQRNILLDFVNAKGLDTELREFVYSLRG